MRLEKSILFAHTETQSDRFQKNPLYLRETHIIWSDNVSFLDKPTLSAGNGSFFRKTYFIEQKKLLYIWDKPTLSNYCDNG